ncbi:MAG: hypothetical protein FD165_2751 [Gammaproteobacteria bacterium]|nr:MAG: hypothetical protein FD165_2751 [Gammaproteobacteria bacterium]TND00882.1 MAG: hypothetical protein FD120_2723 [Gammaproteobacteria bacterium]
MDANNRLTLAYLKSHPRDAARTLERLLPDLVGQLMEEVAAPVAAQVLDEMLPAHAAATLVKMPRRPGGKILEHMSVTRIARLVQTLDNGVARELTELLPARKKFPVRRMLKYPSYTVGTLMEAPHFVLPDNLTANEALRRIKRHHLQVICDICIVDDGQRLVGLLPVGALLKADPASAIRRLMRLWPPSLHARTRIAAAAASPAWRQYRMLPVIEGDNLLVGTIDYETLLTESSGERYQPEVSDPFSIAMELARLYWTSAVALLESLSVTRTQRET